MAPTGQIDDGDKSSRGSCTILHQVSAAVHAISSEKLTEDGVDGNVRHWEYQASVWGLAGRLAGGFSLESRQSSAADTECDDRTFRQVAV